MHVSDPRDEVRAGELLRLRRGLIRLQDEALLLRRELLRRKFNPDQPRVAAGSADGGQWTSGGGGGGGAAFGLGGGGLSAPISEGGLVVDETGEASWSSYSEGLSADGSVFERDIVNRDGSAIQSEYAASRRAGFDERQTVTLTSGETVSFETTDKTQTIRYGGRDGAVVSRAFWTPEGPALDATVQPAFAPMVAAPAIIIGGAILCNWQSPFNGADGRQAVMAFEAREFRPATPGALDLTFSSRVTQDEAEAACRYLPEMQSRLDDTVSMAGPVSDYPSPAAYGTYVHTRLKEQIEAMNRRDLFAEISFPKTLDETQGEPVRYGYPRSVRIDAVEYREDGTVCVYDFKTGKSEIKPRRYLDLGRAGFGGRQRSSRRAIVIQVKPRTL